MKKVIIFVYNMHIGGIQKSLINLLTHLQNKYQVTLFLFSKTGDYANYIPENVRVIEGHPELSIFACGLNELLKKSPILFLKKIFIKFLTFFAKKEIVLTKILKRHLISETFDAAISYQQNGSGGSFMFGCNHLCLKTNARNKFAFIHSDFDKAKTNSTYNIDEYSKFDYLVSVSETGKKLLEKYFDPQKIIVCKNTHLINEISQLSNEYEVDFQPTKNICRLVTVSRISSEKGVDRIIDIAYELETKGIEYIWWVVGGGPLLKEYKGLVENKKIKNLHFVGAKRNPYPYLKISDYLVISSYHEASPMVVQEAQILEKNVLSVNYSSAKEFLLPNCVCENQLQALKMLIFNAINAHPIKFKSFSSRYTNETNEENLKKILKIINEEC